MASAVAPLRSEVSLLFLDGWKGLYLPVLELLEPRLAGGALVIADDTMLLADLCAPYLAHVRDRRNGYATASLAMGDGLELSTRLHAGGRTSTAASHQR